ncbi:MAG: Nif3-like dinuclear metal center hexameric protein [Candidatus Thorarchaeota archaeon]
MDNDYSENIDPYIIRYSPLTLPIASRDEGFYKGTPGKLIPSDDVVTFLETLSPINEFEYAHVDRKSSSLSLGYEIKPVDNINVIYLMINPEFHHLALIPANGLVIAHHKISCYKNPVYQGMLKLAEINGFNIYNFHLAWDSMEGGIGDSFLSYLGFTKNQFIKINLPYKGHQIRNLGAILRAKISLKSIISRLKSLGVDPKVIYNPRCKGNKVGYIPGGGFNDQTILTMAELGVDILISSDHNWVAQTMAREVGMTLIDIDHYRSECFGLQSLQSRMTKKFPLTPFIILEQVKHDQCDPVKCSCDGLESGNNCTCS